MFLQKRGNCFSLNNKMLVVHSRHFKFYMNSINSNNLYIYYMKSILIASTFLYSISSLALTDSLPSAVYVWNQLKIEKTATGEKRQILEGITTHLSYLEIHTTTLGPGKAPHGAHKHAEEEVIIIKEGSLKITLNDSSKIVGPGSVIVIMPDDMHGFVNAGNTNTTYYVIKSRSRTPVDKQRSSLAGGSFVINANDIVYKEGAKGGRKSYFERPTAMLSRFEIHTTTLNEGLQSHDPHTHIAEELMIVVSGNVDFQIGETHHKAAPGDLVLVRSGILHAPKNDGKGACTYFAIQFQ